MDGTTRYLTIFRPDSQTTVPHQWIKSRTLYGVCYLGLVGGCTLLHALANDARAATGAATPFVTLEAEAGTLGGGAIIPSITPGVPMPTVSTLELATSGHSLAELT